MLGKAIFLISVLTAVLFGVSTGFLYLYEIPGAPTVLLIISFLVAFGNVFTTLRKDAGLSPLGHFVIALFQSMCFLGAIAGGLMLAGYLPGLPRWTAIAMLLGGGGLFLLTAFAMGKGPAG